MWHRTLAAASLALLIQAGASRAADDVKVPTFDQQTRFRDIKSGTKRFVQENTPADTEKNQLAIKSMAQFHVARLMSSAAKSAGSSDTMPIYKMVENFSKDVLDTSINTGALSTGQQELIQIFGKEVLTALKPVLTMKEPYNAEKTLLMINAARYVAALGKSGYEDLADTAIAMIENPAIHDAVKLYYLEALKNLFAARNPEQPEKSVFKNPQREHKAIKTLIDFINRKPTFSAGAPQDEIDGFRYVRREAIRALGNVRLPVVRVLGKVETMPALVLLRVANMDKSITPAPSLSERIEALVGYLQLAPDRQINQDFTAGFVGTVLRDLALEYKSAKPLPNTKGVAPEDLPKEPLPERDAIPWKLTATRLSVAMKTWKDNWENNLPPPRPADQKALVSRIADLGESKFFKPANETKRDQVDVEAMISWLQTSKFPNVLLLTDEKSSFIARPEAP